MTGQPLLFSGQMLFIVTARQPDKTVDHIAFNVEWDRAVALANEAIRDGYIDAWVSVVHTALHHTR